MKEGYVTYETAELLKKLGFPQDCPPCCQTYFDEKGRIAYKQADDWYTGRPTHALAMRWLREVKGLYINITAAKINYGDGKGLAVEFVLEVLQEMKYGMRRACNNRTLFDSTYEEAAESGIKASCEYLIRQEAQE